jgi:hypothetical protein
MRKFLAVSVALLWLFAGQSSLPATLVYRYEWTPSNTTTPTPQGDPFSGYMDFLAPTGTDLGIDAIYDFQFTSLASPTTDARGNPLPLIPARTFSLSDVSAFSGSISWNESRITGDWRLNFYFFQELTLSCNMGSQDMQVFYPLEYAFNEASVVGSWVFAGTRNVPESGGTMSLLILSGLAFGGFSLVTRATKPACKAGQPSGILFKVANRYQVHELVAGSRITHRSRFASQHPIVTALINQSTKTNATV